MARLPRLTLPGHVHHVIQRGNNRQLIVVDAADHERLLALFQEHAKQFQVAVHGYVVMPNHFHLLVTPTTETGLPQMMQAVGRSYVRAFNLRHGRSGTLWEGRYRSTVLQAERHLLPAMAYVDLNPVRAGLAGQAGDYAWSSYAHYAGLRHDRLLTPPPAIWALGNTPFEREAAYRNLVIEGLSAADVQAITISALSGWALGDAAFVQALQKLTSRRVHKTQAGRPASKKAPLSRPD